MKPLVEPSNIASSHIRAFFTTKGFTAGHKHICDALAFEYNISGNLIYLPVQKHTNIIQVLESDLTTVVADAVITNRKNIFIGVMVADCVPVLLFDKTKDVIGAVHAGWRGTAQQILKRTIQTMQERFNCKPEDIRIAIGPSIRQCSYEVDSKVKAAVEQATGEGAYYLQQGDKYQIDLSSANRIQALDMRILPDHIWQSEECTFCNPERFYSYRYEKGTAGRQGGFIGMW